MKPFTGPRSGNADEEQDGAEIHLIDAISGDFLHLAVVSTLGGHGTVGSRVPRFLPLIFVWVRREGCQQISKQPSIQSGIICLFGTSCPSTYIYIYYVYVYSINALEGAE